MDFIDKTINKFVITFDMKYMFVVDDYRYMKQLNLDDNGSILKKFAGIHKDNVLDLAVSGDGEFLFTVCEGGVLKQWDVVKKVLVKDFGKVASGKLRSVVVSN